MDIQSVESPSPYPAFNFLDYTMLSSFMSCRRKFYFRHILCFKPDTVSHHLTFGLAWHKGLEFGYRALFAKHPIEHVIQIAQAGFKDCWEKEGGLLFNPDAIFPKNLGIALDMLHQYFSSFAGEDLRNTDLVGVEIPFAIELDPGCPDFAYIGRLDMAVLKSMILGIFEHKTSSRTASAVSLASYENSLQIEGYLLAGHEFFGKLPRVILNQSVFSKTTKGFSRHIISRREEALNRTKEDLRWWWSQIQRELQDLNDALPFIRNQHRDLILPAFRRSPGNACTTFNRKCDFFDLCLSWNNPEHDHPRVPIGFTHDVWDPRKHISEE